MKSSGKPKKGEIGNSSMESVCVEEREDWQHLAGMLGRTLVRTREEEKVFREQVA